MWQRWSSALIIDDEVEDNDFCTAVNIKNKFIGYFLMWQISGKETCTELLQHSEQIPPFPKFRKCKKKQWISFGEFLLNVKTACSFETFLMNNLSELHFLQVGFLIMNSNITLSSRHLPSHFACFIWILVLAHCSNVIIYGLAWVHTT